MVQIEDDTAGEGPIWDPDPSHPWEPPPADSLFKPNPNTPDPGRKQFYVSGWVKAPIRSMEEKLTILGEMGKKEAMASEEEPEEGITVHWMIAVQSITNFDFLFDARQIEATKSRKEELKAGDKPGEPTRAERGKDIRMAYWTDPAELEAKREAEVAALVEAGEEPPVKRKAATVPGRPVVKLNEGTKPHEAAVMNSDQRAVRLSTVEAAMAAFEKGMEERKENRTIYSSQGRRRIVEQNTQWYESTAQARDELWEREEDKADVIRETLMRQKAEKEGIDPAKAPKPGPRPAAPTRPALYPHHK